MKKIRWLVTLIGFTPIIGLISCFGNPSQKIMIEGSKIGQSINESLLRFLRYNPQVINYTASDSKLGIKSVNRVIETDQDFFNNDLNHSYTFTLGHHTPEKNQWQNQSLRTATIAWDKLIVLANMPVKPGLNVDKTAPKIKLEQFIDTYVFPEQQRNFSQLLNLDNSATLKDIKVNAIGKNSHGQSFEEATFLFNKSQRPDLSNDIRSHKNLPDNQTYQDETDLIFKLTKSVGSLTYLLNSQAQKILKNSQLIKDSNLTILEFDQDFNLPVNMIYQTSETSDNQRPGIILGMQLVNMIFSPLFQQIIAKDLDLEPLSIEQYHLQTKNLEVSLMTSDKKIFELKHKDSNYEKILFGLK